MAENENILSPYISKYSGEEIETMLEKAAAAESMIEKTEQLYNTLYESIPGNELYFLVSKNKDIHWEFIPTIEGVEI